ncbi:polysaccharide biosynthesis tyrosine autokinase [Pseudoalteromonas sp. SG43-4]|uniref:polysaccharide biosynthesis tyrosine autokinase n=1 Tax=Pseudoalteromonas sp. SG43-4 TaxID=2760969 RepID=UPI0015FF370D|nr:polysaccharide biosynthesis tyrosine autokinase [Pseudoalteromonas sp. SG43-4]MBB1429359.1 polysaccharide biosynthesis tyrosine autokinase [Pseudoalteromonas sp. SG43-4]
MNSQPSSTQTNKQAENAQDIDLMVFVGAIIDRKFLVLTITIVFMLVGIVYARYSTPIYQVNSILQVESSGSNVPGLDDVGGMFESSSNSTAEIELLKSRSIIGEAVDTLNLDVIATPKLFPYIGSRAYNVFSPIKPNQLAEPQFGADSYAWGGESIDVFRFKVPNSAIGNTFILKVAPNNTIILVNNNEELILKGNIGEELTNGSFTLIVKSLNARPGTEFLITRKNRLGTILGLQNSLIASELGKSTGIIVLEMQHSSPSYAQKVINTIAQIYVRRNVERNSAEAQNSLDFLKVQLPEIKKQLEAAEAKYNNYKIEQQSVDISLETQSVLDRVVTLDTKLQDLDLQRLELSRKFKSEHPLYQGLVEKINEMKKQKEELVQEVGNLPATQQQLLSLRRDVEVNNQIYMLLLSKAQELDVVRAGTVGNVRIIDSAELNSTGPIKPKKSLIVVIATILGALLAITIVIVQKTLNKGVEDPSEIEALGLPVYASVPHSEYQDKLTGFAKVRKNKTAKAKSILAVDNPADLSIEALRSLRTSLHFAMMEAKNNIIAISGPSPGVGKSFISVNLASVLAQGGKKVLIIDADMRKGYLQTQFGIKWDNGLSDYLSGRLNLEQVTKQTKVENLNIITRGQIPPNPSELLMHSNFSKLVEEVSAAYDIILIDTPPILAVTDPAIVSAHVGTTLLVARFGQNHLREIELTRNRFEQNGTDVRGVVFNGVVKKASNAYGYYGYYNYEYKSDK